MKSFTLLQALSEIEYSSMFKNAPFRGKEIFSISFNGSMCSFNVEITPDEIYYVELDGYTYYKL
jgi:hypothetical protein